MMERPDRWCAPLWQARAPRPVRAAWLLWAFIIAGSIGLAVYVSKAHGQPSPGGIPAGKLVAITAPGAVQIALYEEKCALEAVTNLPARAVWVETGGQVVEGCFTVDRRFGLVTFYFADRTVLSLPLQFFTRVTGV